MFLVVLFLFKTGYLPKNNLLKGTAEDEGIVYGTATIEDLVKKDTDGDGVLDWEESLWGMDPNNKETTPGTLDSVAIEKLKIQEGKTKEGGPSTQENEKTLTETDKFSREFFSTVAALNQSGSMDEATAEKLSTALAERMQNSTTKKVYSLSDIKITKSGSAQAMKNYNKVMEFFPKTYKGTDEVAIVLKEFVESGENPDADILLKLNPTIDGINKTIIEMLKVNVPEKLASLHLNVINGLEKVRENLNDMKLYDKDAIMTLGAISQYVKNDTDLELAILNLKKMLWEKLNS